MTQITEIKTIEIELFKDSHSVTFNGIKDDVSFHMPFENYRTAARALTRMAMEMWARMDAEMNKQNKEDEK